MWIGNIGNLDETTITLKVLGRVVESDGVLSDSSDETVDVKATLKPASQKVLTKHYPGVSETQNILMGGLADQNQYQFPDEVRALNGIATGTCEWSGMQGDIEIKLWGKYSTDSQIGERFSATFKPKGLA